MMTLVPEANRRNITCNGYSDQLLVKPEYNKDTKEEAISTASSIVQAGIPSVDVSPVVVP